MDMKSEILELMREYHSRNNTDCNTVLMGDKQYDKLSGGYPVYNADRVFLSLEPLAGDLLVIRVQYSDYLKVVKM